MSFQCFVNVFPSSAIPLLGDRKMEKDVLEFFEALCVEAMRLGVLGEEHASLNPV